MPTVEDKYFAWFDNNFPALLANIQLARTPEEKKYHSQQQWKYFHMKDFMLAMMHFMEKYPDNSPPTASATLDDIEEWKVRVKACAAHAAEQCKLHLVEKGFISASAKLSQTSVCDGVKEHFPDKPLPHDMPEHSPIHKDANKKRGGKN